MLFWFGSCLEIKQSGICLQFTYKIKHCSTNILPNSGQIAKLASAILTIKESPVILLNQLGFEYCMNTHWQHMHFSVSVDFTNSSFNGAWNVVPFYLESLAGSETVLWLRYIMEGRFYSQFFRVYLSRILRCAAARLVSRAPRYCHVTPFLREVHCMATGQTAD